MRTTPISGLKSNNTAKAFLSWRGRRNWSTAGSRLARPICSSAKAISSRCATAHRRHMRRCASAARAVPARWREARIISSTPSSTSSSTIIPRCWKRSTKRSRRSRIRAGQYRSRGRRSNGSTCCAATSCGSVTRSGRWWKSAAGWSTTICRWCVRPCSRCFATSPTTSGTSRSASIRCARCWRSRSRRAFWSARHRRPRSPRGWRRGSPSSRSRPRSRESTG